MTPIYKRVRKTAFFSFTLLCLLFSSVLTAQSVDGIYSDGEVSLHLQEVEDGVYGLFADSDGSYYEAFFFPEEEGLIGMLDEFAAYIPWNTEVMTLIIIPLDDYDNLIEDEAIEIPLEYVSPIQEEQYLDYSNIAWEPITRFGNDFYPSYILATSTWSEDISFEKEEFDYKYYGDRNGFFGFNLSGFPIGSIVRVEVSGKPLAKYSSYTATITHDGVSEIFPIIEYDYNALKNIQQAQPVNFKFAVYVNDQYVGEKLEVIWVRSVNDAVTYAIDHHGREHPLKFIYAAYVNENEPMLDPILGYILKYGIINSWMGTQGSSMDVIKQVFALWYHFQQQGFRYSSITTQSGSDQRSFGQVVRFVGDALKTSQANCVDGTVLFASFLYKVDINVSIVVVPQHAYLAFTVDKEGKQKMALETTMMGAEGFQPQTESYINFVNQMRLTDPEMQKSWVTFIAALEKGTLDYINDAAPGIQEQKPAYMEINIREARRDKIRPIK